MDSTPDAGEEVCVQEGKKENKDFIDASKILRRIPLEIKDKILGLINCDLDLSQWAKIVDWRDVKHQTRFEKFCRDNQVLQVYNYSTTWSVEYERFRTTLIERLPEEPYINTPNGPDIGKEICVMILDSPDHSDWANLPELPRESHRTVHCVLQRPKRERSEWGRRTCLLRSNLDLSDSKRYLLLGNYHDLCVQQDEEMVCIHNTFRLSHLSQLVCDEEDFAYYCKRKWGTINVYRKSLLINNHKAELVGAFSSGRRHFEMAVSGDNVFSVRIKGRLAIIDGYNIIIGDSSCRLRKTRVEEPSIVRLTGGFLGVSGSGFMFLYGIEHYLYGLHNYRQGMKIKKTVIPIRHWLRLNRHTIIILRQQEWNRVEVELISTVDEVCDERCVIRRYSDQFFSVLEPSRRSLWFISGPCFSAHPECIHVVQCQSTSLNPPIDVNND